MTISIITASYNYSQYIEETIKSVLAQTYCNWELIIVDDCSSDNSVEVIKQFDDPRIKLVCHDTNKGLKEAIKTGLSHSTGEWVAFLESDDIFEPKNLEKKLQIAQDHLNVGLIFNDVELFGDERKIYVVEPVFNETRKVLSKMTFPRNMLKDFGVHNRILTFSTVMVKKELITGANFDTPVDKLLDWWLYIHLAEKADFYYINERLTNWRIHKSSYITSQKKFKPVMVHIEAYCDIYKNNNNFDLLFFIIKSTVLSIFIRFMRLNFYRILLVRKIKTILGLPLKDSPLF